MPKATTRKHQVIEDAEIELVLQCTDSHEFYERYRQAFPAKRKGIESITNIWKRRSEFAKKHTHAEQPAEPTGPAATAVAPVPAVPFAGSPTDMAEIKALLREQIAISREILEELKKQGKKKVSRSPKTKLPEPPAPILIEEKPVIEKPVVRKTGAILVGS